MELRIIHPIDLIQAAELLIRNYPDRKIFSFEGEMGAGKTTFIKSICVKLGVKDNVTSPTFSIVNEYSGDKGIRIFHFDFYRIKNPVEVYDLGYEEYFLSSNYCFIEWPEMIEKLLPAETIKITIEVNGGERLINF